MSKQDDAVRGLEQAAAITKACNAAGIADPAEIAPLIAFARAAEAFGTAFDAREQARQAWDTFIATHGVDDPGQDYYAAKIAAARDVYSLARRNYQVALNEWRIARGFAALPEAA